MAIIALGYMGIRSPSLGDWSDYARRQLGMQQVDRGGGTLSFRMDDWQQRLILLDEPGDEFAFMGWQVEHVDDLDDLAVRIEASGIKVTEADRSLCDQRFVTRMIVCDDPDGNRVELFAMPKLATDPFSPGRPIDGFLTGPYGMGHAVLAMLGHFLLPPLYLVLMLKSEVVMLVQDNKGDAEIVSV